MSRLLLASVSGGEEVVQQRMSHLDERYKEMGIRFEAVAGEGRHQIFAEADGPVTEPLRAQMARVAQGTMPKRVPMSDRGVVQGVMGRASGGPSPNTAGPNPTQS